MPRPPTLSAQFVQYTQPIWEPLLALAGEALAPRFMWMHELCLEDGRALHAYKHVHTRRYLHLTTEVEALAVTATGRFRPVEATRALEHVLSDDP